MKAYIRLDPLFDERKSHYTPAQAGALVMVICKAARQQSRGRFRSIAALRGVMPAAYVRHLAFLYDEGDIVLQKDGTVYVDGWDEWQEGDLTVPERMARLRNRRRNDDVTPTVTKAYPPAIHTNVNTNTDVDVGSTEPTFAREDDVVLAYNEATLRTPTGWVLERLNDLARAHGEADACRAIRAAWQQNVGAKPSVHLNAAESILVSETRAAEDARRSRAVEEHRAERERIANLSPEEKAKAEAARARVAEMVAQIGGGA